MDLNFLKPKENDNVPKTDLKERPTPHMPTVDRNLKPKHIVQSKTEIERRDRDVPNSGSKEMQSDRTVPASAQLNTETVKRNETKTIPVVPDRKAKPKVESQDARPVSHSSELQEASKAAADVQKLQQLMKKKQEEYEEFKKDTERMVAEHRARQARIQADQEALKNIQNEKDKQAKETADLMRQKLKIEDELRLLEQEKSDRNIEERKR